MDESFDKWDHVLQHIADSNASVLMYLTEDLVNELAFNSANNLSSNALAEALFLWLDHILNSTFWEHHRRFVAHGYILRVCDGTSGHWTKMLNERLRERGGTIGTPFAGRSISQNLASKSHAAKAVTADASVGMAGELHKHGWGFSEKWDSRPLGMASGS